MRFVKIGGRVFELELERLGTGENLMTSILDKKRKPAGVSTDDSPDTVTARHDEVPSPLKLPAAKEGSCCHEESVPVAMILLLAPCLPDFTSCVDPTWAVLLVTVLVGFLATRMRWSTALVMLGSLSVMVASVRRRDMHMDMHTFALSTGPAASHTPCACRRSALRCRLWASRQMRPPAASRHCGLS